jgi:hypothetical protein
LALLVAMAGLVVVVFYRSEIATRRWLGVGLDTDLNLLEMITKGKLSDTAPGRYLQQVRDRFPGEVVADMIAYVRLHTELGMRVKGIMLMRESGFKSDMDQDLAEQIVELRYLKKSIGKTGQRAIQPALHTNSRDIWQLHQLGVD